MVSFALKPRCSEHRHAATTFYQLQRGFRVKRQCRHNGNIFITVPLPTIIVRHWFVRINVRCGFPNDELIMRTFDTLETLLLKVIGYAIQLLSPKHPPHSLSESNNIGVWLIQFTNVFLLCIRLTLSNDTGSLKLLNACKHDILPFPDNKPDNIRTDRAWNPIRTLVVASPMAYQLADNS